MSKIAPTKPLLIMVYGYPGAGKSYFSRELSEQMKAAHISSDKISNKLFNKPAKSTQEINLVSKIMILMTKEFLSSGLSVIYDVNANSLKKRRIIMQLAKEFKATPLLIWLQIDMESAFYRASNRDHRKIDDKYSESISQKEFDSIAKSMENPTRNEGYIVISGKHTFKAQQSAIIKKMHDLGFLSMEDMTANVKRPQLVNLIPNSASRGRVDLTRRNINIR